MRSVLATVVVATSLAAGSSLANAQMAIIAPFLPDTTLQRTDKISPLPPVVRVSRIVRAQGAFHLSDGIWGPSSEGPVGEVSLALSAADGSNLANQDLGYRYHLVDGNLPDGLNQLPAGAWPGEQGRWEFWIAFGWGERQSWKQESFSFRMYVTAVDRAGNESQPSDTIEVSDAGDNEAEFARLAESHGAESYLKQFESFHGSWSGKDADGKPATLTVSGHQLKLVSETHVIDGFAQAWKDKDGVPRIAVDTGRGNELLGQYELNGNRLKLWLRVPGASMYYDLRRAH